MLFQATIKEVSMLKRRPVEVEYIPPGQMGAEQNSGVSTGAVLGIIGALAAGAIGVAAVASSRKSAATTRGALGSAPLRKRKCNCGR